MKEILLVGRRQAAIDAADALGCSFSVQEVASRDEQADGAFGGNMTDSVAAAKKRYRRTLPDAVVAVAEGAVPSAAAIRDKFGLGHGLNREAALLCHDKLLMKKAITAAGIPCAPWLETTLETRAEEIVERFGLPVVLKQPVSSGGRGVTVCGDLQEIAHALRPGLLAEAFTTGVEMSVETLRQNQQTLFRNHTRYLVPQWASIVPADTSDTERTAIDELTDRVHDALDIGDGMTHMEIFLTTEGPVFSEIAARPPGGRLMELIGRAYGFDAWQAVLSVALGRTPDLPADAARFAGAWLLYPNGGAGVVSRISGLGEARKMPNVARLKCRAKPGRHYAERLGSGQIAGEIIVVADTMGECERQLREAHDAISIEVTPDCAGGTPIEQV